MTDLISWSVARIQLNIQRDEHLTDKHQADILAWFADETMKGLFFWMTEGALTIQYTKRGEEERIPAAIRQGTVREFCYFLRREKVVVNLENATEMVAFGCCRGDMVELFLTTMINAYVPLSMVDYGWPENVRKEITSQTQKFMATVTEMSNQAKGMTVLYIPLNDEDAFSSDSTKGSSDRNVVPRLEASLIHWTRQIKEVTTSGQETAEGESAGPLDEIEFWRARHVDLSRLHGQLQSPELQRILQVLEVAKSSYLKPFRTLEVDIQKGALEARENLKYLQVLQEPCENLAKATPVEIPKVVPHLLNCVRMIWTISTHYNTGDRISNLLRKMSNEIIKRCQAAINLDEIFEGNVDACMMTLQECIGCGREWKRSYMTTCRLSQKANARPWTFPEGNIFAQVDAFVQRCCDLLDICEGQLQFSYQRRGVELPAFGGTNAPEITKSLTEIEENFQKQVEKLRSVGYNILDVKATKWHDDFSVFKNQMKDLEVMYMNVINSAFEVVSTVRSCVEVLDNFHMLAKRERIKSYVEKKSLELYGIFNQELANVKREFEHFRKKPVLPNLYGHPNYAGTALWVRGLLLRIGRHKEEFESLSYLESSREHEGALENYSSLHTLLESFIQQIFSEWVAEVKAMDDSRLPDRLNTGLLMRPEDAIIQRTRGTLLESNFDKQLVLMFQEVYYWEKIQGSGIVVPYAAHDMASHRDTIRVLQQHVLRVVRDYNVIIDALQPGEKRLFNHHIRNLDRKIGPGLTKYTWNSQGIKEFFVRDSTKECAKIYDFVKQFKKNNEKIAETCRTITDQHLILIEKKQVHRDEEFRLIQEKHRAVIKVIFQEAHAKITETMLQSYQIFEGHPSDIQREWKSFVEKTDKKIEDALKRAVKTSLQDLCRALNGDSKTEPSPLFKISAILEGSKMDFKPTLTQLKDLLQMVCRDMTMILTAVPRLWDHLQAEKGRLDLIKKQHLEDIGDIAAANAIVLPSEEASTKKTFFEEISKDDECCIRHVKEVLKGFNSCAVKLGERLKWWNSSYQPIVSQDKDAFIRRYARTERPLSVVGQDIQRYRDVQQEITQEDFKVVIGFIETDFGTLKSSLVSHCQQWQGKLTGLLNHNALRDMDALVEYFEHSSATLLDPPTNLNELKVRLDLLHECQSSDAETAARIKPIEEQYAKLSEFEVFPPDAEITKKNNLHAMLTDFRNSLLQAENLLGKSKKSMRAQLENDVINFQQVARDLKVQFHQTAPFSVDNNTNAHAVAQLQTFEQTLAQKREQEKDFIPKLDLFQIEPQQHKELDQTEKELDFLKQIWTVKEDWDQEWNTMKQERFRGLDTEAMDTKAAAYQKRVTKLKVDIMNWPIWQFMKSSLDEFRNTIPLIEGLRHNSMRERHWKVIMREIHEDFDPFAEDFTLGCMFDLRLSKCEELVFRLTDEARKEYKIETGLAAIEETWATMLIDVVEHKGCYYKLRSTEDLFTALEENILLLASFKSSQFYLPFKEKVEYWERTISNISEIVEEILVVQRAWMYLENIFVGSEDIRPHLPRESVWFDEVNDGFLKIMKNIFHNPLATSACAPAGMLEALTHMSEKLDNIQKSLDDYLEKKRQFFPRFYFLSNDDLLEILGQAKDPEQVQKHIKKCFEGVKTLELMPPSKERGQKGWEAVGLNSPDGEKVKLSKAVQLEPPVEGWLCSVERRMKESLRKLLNVCHQSNVVPKGMKKEKWVKEFPGQLLITSGQIAWTTDCHNALVQVEKGRKNALKLLKKQQTKYIAKLTEMIRKPLSKVERGKLVALITIEVHSRDVQDRMITAKTESPANFNWTSQLRFELREMQDSAEGAGTGTMTCWCVQTNTWSPYGYEYQGNNGRLVVTPMTDRCYMTLTTAMHLKRGGAPQGPAGTGKTESVKDLGKGMAKYVIVFNCSDGLDFKSLGRMFSGLVQSGSWGCFDEFNRIDIEVLSVVAIQIMTIQDALREEKDRMLFEERMIKCDRGCAIFITMNPGYAGRTELPDNLKSLFRPVAMMVPDLNMIAEIMLVSEGFKDFKPLARKMISMYSIMMQQMSKQDHYDFGLRSLKSVLNCAGAVKRADPEMPETNILMRAINDMNFHKWVSQDVPLYVALLSDVFPGVELGESDYGLLDKAITSVLVANGMQLVRQTIGKSISIYETKITRHGNMLLGGTLGGKSTCWKTLQEAKTQLAKEGVEGYDKVITYIINPKALSLDELYGAYDLSTMEWTDGILSCIMRLACQDEKPDEKWLVLDGPVDTLWIESMNTVLDDNKVLTLINGDRISMPPQVSLLFEVEDLSVASPATVSRAGMVYFDAHDLGWEPFVHSWIDRLFDAKADRKAFMKDLFDKWFAPILKVRKARFKELVHISDPNAAVSCTHVFEALLKRVEFDSFGEKANEVTERMFAFAIVWSLGASLVDESRLMFDNLMREIENVFPQAHTVFDYGINFEKVDFSSWEERLPNPYKPAEGLPFHKIIVPTVDTVRNTFIIKELMLNYNHFLCVGNTGTGKTVAISQALSTLDDNWTTLTLNFSAQSSSGKTQEILEGKLEKRIKNKFGPPGNKRMVCFVDDLNMPLKDTFGSQPPLELFRQWVDYGSWYDRGKQQLRIVLDVQLAAGMGPPGGGRAVISRRFQSRFNLINFTDPADVQVRRIFLTLANHKLGDFREEIKLLAEPLVTSTILLYNLMGERLLATPAKCHYLFNLRDVSRVFQGIYLAKAALCEDKDNMLKLWFHECCRVFRDRLIMSTDQGVFHEMMDHVVDTGLQMRVKDFCGDDHEVMFASVNVANPDMEDPPYEYQSDRVGLKAFLEQKLDDYNEIMKKSPLNLVMFQDAVAHCMKILRIIRMARGNAMLVGVGGSGRHCQTRLASFVADYECFMIEIDKSYNHTRFRDDLKILYEKTGVKAIPTVFLYSDTEVVTESFLEDVSNVLSSGEVPNLWGREDLNAVLANVEKPAKEAGIPFGAEALYEFLISRARENLKVALCMSPIGSSFRNYCRMYPSLVNCMTIDWFLVWPPDALQEVALKFLQKVESIPPDMVDNISVVFGNVHTAVIHASDRLLIEMKRYNYVTPTNYLELVAGYVETLESKQRLVGGQADKLRNGLYKLTEARSQVETMSVELEVKQDIVAKKQKECQELLVIIVEKRMNADEQQKQVEADSARIEKEAADTKALADDAQRDLGKAMPALEAAVDALEKLDKKSIAEVKAYAKPPEAVMKTMNAVMTVMEKPPNWASAKQELNDVNFLPKIKNFDKDNISNSTLKKMEKFVKDPSFAPSSVVKVSLAAGALCQWVHAMSIYSTIFREVEPKRLKLKVAQETLERKMAQMNDAKAKLKAIQDLVQQLKDQYDESTRSKEELTQTAEELKIKLERADKLVSGLAGEKGRWEVSVDTYDRDITNLVGDCLVAAAFLSYAGPFGSKYRDKLVADEWLQPVRDFAIPATPNFSFSDFLADPTDVREWNIQGLPTDGFSTENGVVVTRGRRWPLMIDPQNQANKWIRKMGAKKSLKVFGPNTKDYMNIVERSIEFGTPCLMENVMEELDPSLEPVLAKNIIRSGGSLSIKIGDATLDYNPAFKFYLTTKLSNPHYTPEVSTKTTIVNFIVVEEGLTNQLLGVVVMKEEQRLEEQKTELVLKVANGKNRLVELENDILRLLSESKGSLLDDLNLIGTLQESKTISEEVTEKVRVAEQTMVKIDAARENYRPCGLRAAILFFVLNDMVAVDSMYQFALDAYVDLFNMSIDKSAEKHPMVSSVEERVELLNAYHTLAVYRYGCRALFERHKLLLSLNICSTVLHSIGGLHAREYEFFLLGGHVMDHSTQANIPAEWISQVVWDNITELDQYESFKGFVQSFEQTLREWEKWYSAAEPEKEPLPGEWDARLDPLQKLIVVRCIRMDRVVAAAKMFVSLKMDQKFVEPPSFDLAAIFEESSSTVPLLFVLTPGMDPTPLLSNLGAQKNIKWQAVSLGQGQAPKATKSIMEGSQAGFWVFLANCHLSISYMPELEKLVTKIAEEKHSPDYRLWLSSDPTPNFPIALLQKLLKMTTEPPKSLKANLTRLIARTKEEDFNRVHEAAKYRKLFFSLIWFHSILLERRKFKSLGWNTMYDFNDSDFDICENILAMYLDEYPNEIPWDAIKYLIAEANYGGRVTELPDNRVLRVYVDQVFCPAALLPKFMLSSSPAYYIPEDATLQGYANYVRDLPFTEPPEAFGEHGNAEIASALQDTNDVLTTLLNIRGGGDGSGASGKSKDDVVLDQIASLLEKIPEPLDWNDIAERNESDASPLKVCMLQEIERYNGLLVNVRQSLILLRKGIEGFVVISDEQETILDALFMGRVPLAWPATYPSVKPLSTWTPDLIERIEMLNQWGMFGTPKLFWLGGFTYPTGFLTALLQASARKNMLSVDTLSFDFSVQAGGEETLTAAPKEGAYIKSMILEGAKWSPASSCLAESDPMQLFSPMPVVHFKPVTKKKTTNTDLYSCPLYMYPVRTGSRERPSFVIYIELKAGAVDPGFWIKQGTALLLTVG